jgi:hypothetical protein
VKVGDLVRARSDLDDNQGFVPKGEVGIITKRTQTGQSSCTIVVKFPNSTYITCLWQELEILSEG